MKRVSRALYPTTSWRSSKVHTHTIGDYRIPDTDPELVPKAAEFKVSPGVYRGQPQGQYLECMFNRVQQQVLSTDRGSLAIDKARDQTVLYLGPLTETDYVCAPILRHLEAEEVWLVLEPPHSRWEK